MEVRGLEPRESEGVKQTRRWRVCSPNTWSEPIGERRGRIREADARRAPAPGPSEHPQVRRSGPSRRASQGLEPRESAKLAKRASGAFVS